MAEPKNGTAMEGQPMLHPESSAMEIKKKQTCINPRLIPAKLLMFLVQGGHTATFAFVTMHMRSIGISVAEIAVVLLIIPIVSSIGPPMSGALADRFGNYKAVLIIFTLLSAIFSTCMWFLVPSFGVVIAPTVFLAVSPAQTGNISVQLPCYPPVEIGIPTGSEFGHATYRALYTISGSLLTEEMDLNHTCPHMSDCGEIVGWNLDSDARLCFTSPRNITHRDLDRLHELQKCVKLPPSASFLGGREDSVQSATSKPSKIIKSSDNLLLLFLSNQSQICQVRTSNLSYPGNLTRTCIFTFENPANRSADFPQLTGTPFGNRALTISLYFVFRFLSFTSSRGVFPLLDAAILQVAKQEGGDFGEQRLFSNIGSVVAPALAGWLSSVASRSCQCDNFGPAFYLFGIMTVAGALLMYWTDIRVTKKQTEILRTMGIVLRDPNVVAFLLAVFFCGSAWGFAIGYLFIFIEDDPEMTKIPSLPTLLGFVSGAGYGLGIPFLYFSTKLIKFFGHENLIAAILFCHATRFLAYSYTYSPYLILPTEIFTGFTFLAFVVPPQFAMKTAPKYIATLVGLFGAANFGLGGGIGPLTGGFLIYYYGFRTAFRSLSVSFFAIGLIYLAVFHIILKKPQPNKAALNGTGPSPPPSGLLSLHKPLPEEKPDLPAVDK